MQNEKKSCPVCESELIPIGKVYTINELFDLWKPVEFPIDLIERHAQQSRYTQRYKCSICKLEIFLPQIIGDSEFYQFLSQHESANYYEDIKWEFKKAFTDLNKSDSVIEIGCGPGNFLEMIKPFVSEVYGIEYNENAQKIAENKGMTVFKSVEDSNVFKKKFEKVFAFHVLEHVKEPSAFIEYLFDIAKNDGSVCLSVPNQSGPLKYINPCPHNMPPHHATIWNLKTFKQLAKRLDLHISRYCFEPLTERDSYYYTIHFANYIVSPNSRFKRILNKLLSGIIRSLLYLTFRIFSVFSQNEIPFIKGQSLYISLKK